MTGIGCSYFGLSHILSLFVPSLSPPSQNLALPLSCFRWFALTCYVRVPMADPYSKKAAPSPISQLLKTLGMTREDLVQHTEQMRAHLSQTNTSETTERSKSKSRSLQRSRTTSLSNLAVRTLSSTPPRTPVKSEPLEHGIPARQMDTMQLVMERKSRQAKRERRGMKSNTTQPLCER